jgi:hypothetical protein
VVIAASIDASTKPAVANYADVIQVGAGYKIEGIGLIRAQYFGNSPGWNYGAGMPAGIQGGFALTAVAGLTVDADITYFLANGLQSFATVAASYSKDAISTYGRVKPSFGNNADLNLDVMAAFAYTIVDTPFRVGVEATGSSLLGNATTIAAFPYLRFGYAKGNVKVGVAVSDNIDATANGLGFKIPLVLEYGF